MRVFRSVNVSPDPRADHMKLSTSHAQQTPINTASFMVAIAQRCVSEPKFFFISFSKPGRRD
jgi:hypothetical protein